MDDETLVGHVESLRQKIQQVREDVGGSDALYMILYQEKPVGNQSNTFRNFVNRGAFKAQFLALCTERLGWHDVTLGEIFSSSELKRRKGCKY